MFKTATIPEGFIQNPENPNEYRKLESKGWRWAFSDEIPTWAVIGKSSHLQETASRKEATERFRGYFPVLAFDVGEADMKNAVDQLYGLFVEHHREFTEYSYTTLKKVKGHQGEVLLITEKSVKIYYTAFQKIHILVRSIALFARGLITYGQFGIVFAPFDAAANWYWKKG